MFNIYDEPEMPNEGFVFKIYGELESTREWSNVPSQLQYFRQGGLGEGAGRAPVLLFQAGNNGSIFHVHFILFRRGGGGHYYYLFFFRRGERGLAPLLLFQISIRKNNGSKIHFHFFIFGGGIVSMAQQIDGSILHFHFVIFGGGVVLLVQNSGSILHVHFMLFQRGRREGGGGVSGVHHY